MAKRTGQSAIAGGGVGDMRYFLNCGGAVMARYSINLGYDHCHVRFLSMLEGEGERKTNRYWGYVGFIGFSSRLVAKGPVAIVIMV